MHIWSTRFEDLHILIQLENYLECEKFYKMLVTRSVYVLSVYAFMFKMKYSLGTLTV